MTLDELATDEKAYRHMQHAAAALRLVTDRRLKRGITPKWVGDLAAEEGEPILGPGWIELAINRLDRNARAAATGLV